MSFPITPADGFEYVTPSGIKYIYDAANNAWNLDLAVPVSPIYAEIDSNIADFVSNIEAYRTNFPFATETKNVHSIKLTDVVSEAYSDFSSGIPLESLVNINSAGFDDFFSGDQIVDYELVPLEFRASYDISEIFLFDVSSDGEFSASSEVSNITLTL